MTVEVNVEKEVKNWEVGLRQYRSVDLLNSEGVGRAVNFATCHLYRLQASPGQ